tara:strand:+ start:983 stop:1423 length:441 start_codon:yes stop_codon:yes gene_type:complete
MSDEDVTIIDEVNPDIKPLDKPTGKVMRDPVSGKFLAGTAAGPGRPHGAKSQFNKQVIDSLQALWEKDGAEMLEMLARDKPEVIMGMVSRMIPQALAAEAITGEKGEGNQGDRDVTIRVVTQQHQDVLPPREVEGELLIGEDSTTH